MKRIRCFVSKQLHPFGVDCHRMDYISNPGLIPRMNHEEKVQMLSEVGEIRALLLQLNKSNSTGGEFGTSGFSNGLPRGKRILDLF